MISCLAIMMARGAVLRPPRAAQCRHGRTLSCARLRGTQLPPGCHTPLQQLPEESHQRPRDRGRGDLPPRELQEVSQRRQEVALQEEGVHGGPQGGASGAAARRRRGGNGSASSSGGSGSRGGGSDGVRGIAGGRQGHAQGLACQRASASAPPPGPARAAPRRRICSPPLQVPPLRLPPLSPGRRRMPSRPVGCPRGHSRR